ncbi:asparagine synthase (glutamine-hydrolyzing) [Pannus brasiliensis CCIBt3594]|uniref:asparagine synthase (glutamine-hydrolyzing) n=1 Tax=Pannus brasiliensis CCIBt3594 TaxID=1427578 RepID=A0AAW9QSB9_9CHRO
MCGIAGIIHFDRRLVSPRLLETLSQTLSHRGPDDLGFLLYSPDAPLTVSRDPDRLPTGHIGLIHRRLAILDLSEAGWQPMVSSDGNYAITFNGEIYNYLELQQELKQLGYSFHSHSDTEVLLTAYRHWGQAMLTRLVGMFAFAILDTRKQEIFLARDFFGIKPLYYTRWEGGFAFASEIKTLLQLPEIDRQLDSQRLYDFLTSGLTDSGDVTLLKSIRQLRAAHSLKIPLETDPPLEPRRYWQVTPEPSLDLSFTDAARTLQELFLDNIRLHLRSDVPVGVALSGGVDSSSIAAAMRYLNPSLELHSFSYAAEDPAINEESWIDIVVTATGAISHKTRPDPRDLIRDLDRLVYTQDEPFGSTSIYAQYRVFQLARDHGIKVMLDGQGADELLAGYYPYLAGRLASLIRQGKWIQARQFFERIRQFPSASQYPFFKQAVALFLPIDLKARVKTYFGKPVFPAWLNREWFLDRGVHNSSIPRLQGTELLKEQLLQSLETSLLGLLRYEDRNSMAYSIESRVPFLTPKFVNFLFSLPEQYIVDRQSTTKAVFRQAMRGIVPDPILDRRDKIGFATPERDWLTLLNPWVQEVLNSEYAREIPVINLEVIQQEWQELLEGRGVFNFRVWRWLNLIQWARQYQIDFS